MMVYLANYTRNPEHIHHETEGGEIRRRWHKGECPNCGAIVEWEQHCEVWTEGEDGYSEPDWDASEAWNCTCPECGAFSVDPYEDGLIRVWIAE